MAPAALANAYCYNNVEKRRAYYCVPHGAGGDPVPHLGIAGREGRATRSPTSRRPGMPLSTSSCRCRRSCRKWACATPMPPALSSARSATTRTRRFAQFLIAYGGLDIVTPDGKLHADDPQVQEAVIKSLDKLTSLYKDGYIPPSSINWNDADDNNAFHSKLCVMDFDGTLSTELAMLRQAEGRIQRRPDDAAAARQRRQADGHADGRRRAR